jgi:hypothetical protein
MQMNYFVLYLQDPKTPIELGGISYFHPITSPIFNFSSFHEGGAGHFRTRFVGLNI